MKRITVLMLCITLLLCGCSKKEDNTGTIPPVIPETTQASAVTETMTVLTAVSVPATTETYYLDEETELFSYTFQHMNLIFPNETVANTVTLDFLNRVDGTQEEADRMLETAQAQYSDTDTWIPHFYRVLYSPTRIDRGVLSLFGIQNSYAGGMHGNLSCISVNYDMTTGDVLTLGSIMHQDATKEDFIQIVTEKLLELKDQYYLYDDYQVAVQYRLGGDENLYEDFYFTPTGLNFYFSPYEIAPYASGIITVEIPYSELIGLIYDGYYPDERMSASGKMYTGDFMDVDMTQFNNMAEVMLSDENNLKVVYPEGTVQDISVVIAGDGMSMPQYTIFAALEMADQDAVVLNLPKELETRVKVYYTANEETVTTTFN